MSIDLFAKTLKQILPLTKQVCLHVLGEPLAHPHFDQIIKICSQNGARVYLVTNGILLNSKRQGLLETLHDPCIDQISFSVHSFFDNFSDQLSAHDPQNYLEQVLNLSQSAQKANPKLFINLRLWNLKSKSNNEHKWNEFWLTQLHKRFGFTIPHIADPKIQKSYRIGDRFRLHFDSRFEWPSIEQPFVGKKGRCYALKNHFGVLVNGDVIPCCLDHKGLLKLGNVENMQILEVLNSNRALQIKEGFRQNKCVEKLCQHCNYIKRFESQKK